MTTNQIRKLDQIFRMVFELPENAPVTQISQTSQENWDSLRHVTLVTAIESEFNISIDVADAMRITSYETVRKILEEQGRLPDRI